MHKLVFSTAAVQTDTESTTSLPSFSPLYEKKTKTEESLKGRKVSDDYAGAAMGASIL